MASRAGFLGALLLVFLFFVVIGVLFVLYMAGVFVGPMKIGGWAVSSLFSLPIAV